MIPFYRRPSRVGGKVWQAVRAARIAKANASTKHATAGKERADEREARLDASRDDVVAVEEAKGEAREAALAERIAEAESDAARAQVREARADARVEAGWIFIGRLR